MHPTAYLRIAAVPSSLILTAALLAIVAASPAAFPGTLPKHAQQKSLLPEQPDPCYEEDSGKPRRCIPDFVNAAFGKVVAANSECGDPPTRYCEAMIDESTGAVVQNCRTCDAGHSSQRHPAEFLTDLNNPNNVTCWMSKPISHPSQNVSLTLTLGKKYELTYISLQFCGPKPDSMAMYKSMDYGRSWQPFQFYSTQCRKVFDRPPQVMISRANEQEPLCSDPRSGVEPLTGGRVAFSTLEGRPSGYDFDNSPVLQDWVTATDVKIVFVRMKPWHPTPAESSVLLNDTTELSYFSVSDLSVGGRCKCNGHASKCIYKGDSLFCDCKHNTAGKDCEKCKAFHFDRPWSRATAHDVHECVGRASPGTRPCPDKCAIALNSCCSLRKRNYRRQKQ